MIELADSSEIEAAIDKIRIEKPAVFISVAVHLNAEAAPRVVQLAAMDVDTLHFYADDNGNELDTSQPRFLKEMIRQIHLALVEKGIRQKVNLLFSGGIAMAEHMAKAIICGADAITVDNPLLIALECRLCRRCRQNKTCPVKLGEIKVDWGRQRIVNLIGAWRNQLLEVMGAMGIREARRLRGEVGRSMWFENLEKESFAPIFGERRVKGVL
jgi:imidazole glycerol phosphate synthase subunit HisF